jgi:hypothetical protein
MNPKIKWIVLINPPFATAQEAGMKGKSKEGVSDTKIRQRMHAENFGEASRELYTQFLYRVKYEFKNCKANLGLFSKIKYLNANNDQKFRDSFFHCTFMQGFVFSSVNFHGTSRTSPFPISFILWDINKEKSLEKQNIVLDVFNNEVKKTETKQIVVRNRTGFLNKWIIRPPATIKFPPFGSAIEVKSKNIDRRDRVAENFLASFMCCGNDLYHQLNTALLSGPYVSAGAFSVTPENFEQAMVAHAARKIPKSSWFNDGDQFMKPNQDLSEEFITDCTIWNLFCNSNQTAALCNVKYEEKTYQIHNHFFPFKINEIKKWDIADNDIKETLFSAEDTFVAKWLSKRKLSEESRNVWNQAKKVYRFYFVNLNDLRTPKFKIETYDAGWWQIRQALQDAGLGGKELEKLKQFHYKLREKLLPQLSGYGMIVLPFIYQYQFLIYCYAYFINID